jgi:hypothetical protein
MTTYVSVKESAAIVRNALKAELGLTSRQVSVRADSFSMGSAVRVSIKAPVSREKVEQIANGQQRISYCEYSGEVLSGGNRYVTVDYDWQWVKAYGEQFVEKLPTDGETVQVTEDARCTNKGGRYCFEVRQFGMWREVNNVRDQKLAGSCWADRVLHAL